MRRYGLTIAIVVVFLVMMFGGTAVTLFTDWLWFKDLNYGIIFSKTIWTRIDLGLIFGLLFFIVVYANLWLARYIAPPPTVRIGFEEHLGERFGRMAKSLLGILIFLGTLFFAGLVGLEAGTHWEEYLRFAHSTPFGKLDPIFSRDIAFYVFRLPFLRYLYGWLFFTFLAATVATTALYYANEKIDMILNVPQFAPKVKGHLAVLVATLFMIKAWGYYLDRFSLLTNPGDLFYGAGYTDVHTRLWVFVVLMVTAVVAAVLVLLNISRRGIKLALSGLILLLLMSFFIGAIVPYAVQQLVVKPNEYNKEVRYIEKAIANTRDAFKISLVDERQYPVKGSLSPQALSANQATTQNIRLWDYRPLLSAYAQLQEIQQYYSFKDVDVDRYTLNGRFRQVMLSARELDPDQLSQSAQTWVNRRLIYTHGYGFVMSPVSEVSEEGLPTLYIKDLPPQSSVNLSIKRPEIYFGEVTQNYVFVDTHQREFDYPSGDQAVTTEYQGDGGVPIGSFFRRLAFALRFSDLNMLLNRDLRPSSRVLFRRNIRDRVRTLMPFLSFDGDPYLVVSEGRMYWFQDAYTTADSYPYSQMVNWNFDGFERPINYIRNSVKVVTDAYTGEISAYIADPSDPIIKTYARIFPGVFKPLSKMPADQLAHIRYPEDLFSIQAEIFSTYHMTDPSVFYNKGDLWTVPNVPDGVGTDAGEVGGEGGRMEPNYIIMRLPGRSTEEMIILTPFTRANKNNMVAWLCAINDHKDYGKLVMFEFPKGELVYGPAQVSGRISQDPRISQLLTLWNQQGSQVVRGNLLVIPIEGTMLYVEPLYLQSTGAKIPELKRVIVALGNRISMDETLSDALAGVLGMPSVPTAGQPSQAQPLPQVAPSAAPSAAPAAPGAAASQARQLIDQANRQLDEAERSQRAGDWAGYGRQIGALKETLRKLQGVSP